MYVVETTPSANGSRRTSGRAGLCPPVPTLVDNLWEWKRPDGLPSRRTSIFASPAPKVALERVGCDDPAVVRRVSLPVGVRVAQLTAGSTPRFDPSDAKFHPDVKCLPAVLQAGLGPEWESGPLHRKARAGLLWVPGLAKDEVEMLFQKVPALVEIREKVWNAIRFWNYVQLLEMLERCPDPRGELFFESPDGYWLEPLEPAKPASESEQPTQSKPRLLTRLLAKA